MLRNILLVYILGLGTMSCKTTSGNQNSAIFCKGSFPRFIDYCEIVKGAVTCLGGAEEQKVSECVESKYKLKCIGYSSKGYSNITSYFKYGETIGETLAKQKCNELGGTAIEIE